MKNKILAPLMAVLAVSTFGTTAYSQMIINDTFTGADGTTVNSSGYSPDVNAPGGSYIVSSSNDGSTIVPTIEGNQLVLDGSSTAAISLASAGTYVKPTQLTISGQIEAGGIEPQSPDDSFVRGIGLGFTSSPLTGQGDGLGAGFAGVVIDTYSGNIDLLVGDNNFAPVGTIAYDSSLLGTFSEDTLYTLSYTVDTTTGDISAVTLSDSLGTQTGTFGSVNLFTDAQTQYAVVAAPTNGATPELSFADNLQVTGPIPTPEPGTWALVLFGFAGLIIWQRRRRLS